MYKFSLSDERMLFAINEDANKPRKLADEISWFREYDNLVIALGGIRISLLCIKSAKHLYYRYPGLL